MVPLKDVMTTELVTVSPNLTLQELAEVFAQQGISGAPVVSGRELVGVISTTDLVEFESTVPKVPRRRDRHVEWGEIQSVPTYEAGEDVEPGVYFTEYWEDAGADVLERFKTESPEWNRMAETTVASFMTTSVVSLSPEDSVQEAAGLMRAAGVHRILVVDRGGELVGIVASSDVVRAVAERGLKDA